MYRYNALYPLDGLAVVNVKDNPPMKDMFKLLMFRAVFFRQKMQKSNGSGWKAGGNQERALSEKTREREEAAAPRGPPQVTPKASSPFEDEKTTTNQLFRDRRKLDLSMEWIQELPEDLDVCIAQRDFEGAVDLLDKLNHYPEDKPSHSCKRTKGESG